MEIIYSSRSIHSIGHIKQIKTTYTCIIYSEALPHSHTLTHTTHNTHTHTHFVHVGSPSGKVTVAEHRSSVLSAIESLSRCPLSSSSQHELAAIVTKGLVAHIKQEGNL